MSERKYKFVTMFYNCRSEEASSWEYGHKIISKLVDNQILYALDYPPGEEYECTVSALRPTNMTIKEFNSFLKNL